MAAQRGHKAIRKAPSPVLTWLQSAQFRKHLAQSAHHRARNRRAGSVPILSRDGGWCAMVGGDGTTITRAPQSRSTHAQPASIRTLIPRAPSPHHTGRVCIHTPLAKMPPQSNNWDGKLSKCFGDCGNDVNNPHTNGKQNHAINPHQKSNSFAASLARSNIALASAM